MGSLLVSRNTTLPLAAAVAALGACTDEPDGFVSRPMDAGATLDVQTDAQDARVRDRGPVIADRGPPPPDVPPVENCDTPFDDNNDGHANENCPCTPGTTQMCFERPREAFGEFCRMGTQRCESTGGGSEFGRWTECDRSWLPLPSANNECHTTEGFPAASESRPPVDVVWFVDNSGSMTEETRYVNMNLNTFAGVMEASGLDYRVIMIARRGTGSLQVCATPPLGGANCGDGPRFRHVDQQVESTDGLQLVLNTYSRWGDFVRPQALKFFVAVTDDNSALSADAFDAMIRMRPPFERYTFHSIVGYNNRTECPTLATVGTVYLTLTERTMGERARICDMDWSGIFTSFARSIVRRTNFFTLTTAPHLDTIRVYLIDANGRRMLLPMTAWSYDPMTMRLTVDPAAIPGNSQGIDITYRPASASP